MHNLVTTAESTFNNEAIQTMSSVEIAELCGKQHKNVMRDITKIFNELKFEPVDFSGTYVDAKGETRPCYYLPKRECLILVSGYSTALRAKIIDRWQELEGQLAEPQIDYSKPEALLGVLNHLQSQIEQRNHVIAALEPKAMALESLQRHEGLFGLTEAAKILEMQPKQFILFLQQKGWVYRRMASGHLLPYQDKIQKGLMDCSTVTIQTNKGTEKLIPAAKITTKGMAIISQEIKIQNMH